MSKTYDYLIIGAGIMGLSLARALKAKQPQCNILILDKEADCAYHASGRNSGVLHAGFYYTADSLKAKFTVEGNRRMKEYCRSKDIPMNECGKLVVAQNKEELEQLYELERRGKRNGSNIRIISEKEAMSIEPSVKTFQKALHSPDTASVDPNQVCHAIKEDLKNLAVDFSFDTEYLSQHDHIVFTSKGEFTAPAGKIINCSGLYADKVAQDFGFGQKYTMMPFKGLYLKYTKNKTDIKTNIYPVPNLKNPFLGVHYTKTVAGDIKIGPTAIPAFWRENYKGFGHFSFSEFTSTAFYQSKLFLTNSFKFRELAFEEIRKYNKDYFIGLAVAMVQPGTIDPSGFTQWTKPGIRAQLLDKAKLSLVQDFVVEGDDKSIHILNAVSPAFTCAFPFSDHIVEKYILA
jgi:L-2-hydroxyglutarate oxidase